MPHIQLRRADWESVAVSALVTLAPDNDIKAAVVAETHCHTWCNGRESRGKKPVTALERIACMLTPSVSVEAGMWSRSQNDADQVYIQTALRSHVAPLMGDPLNTKIRITGVSLDRPVLSFDCSQWRIVAPSTRSPCCMCMFCFYAEAELTAHIILFGILQFSRSFAWPTAPDEDCPVWLEQHKMLVIVALIWDRLDAGAGFCLVWCYSSWCQD